MNKDQYLSQVELLLDCLPVLANQKIFALKGGTAINFFLQDMPRLSNERKFLLSIKTGQPDYSLMPFDNLADLPALKWKLINIQKMDKNKHARMLDELKSVLMI